jgi:HSP20 family protein
MTLVKTNPGILNNLIDDFFVNFPATWGKDFETSFYTVNPQVNIHETADGYHLELNVPGRKKDLFKIEANNGTLTISYEESKETENKDKDYKTLRREFKYSSFKRSFTIDDKINADNIQAKYEEGILKIYLPKKEEIKLMPKQITVL